MTQVWFFRWHGVKITQEKIVPRFTVPLTGGFVETVEKKVERAVCCLAPTHRVTSHIRYLIKCCSFLAAAPQTLSLPLCNFLCSSLAALTNQREEPPGSSRVALLFAISGLMMEESSCLNRFECRAQLVSAPCFVFFVSRLLEVACLFCFSLVLFSLLLISLFLPLFFFFFESIFRFTSVWLRQMFLFAVSVCTRHWHLVLWIVQLYLWV